MIVLLAATEGTAGGISPVVWVVYAAVFIGFFYFMVMRPQKK